MRNQYNTAAHREREAQSERTATTAQEGRRKHKHGKQITHVLLIHVGVVEVVVVAVAVVGVVVVVAVVVVASAEFVSVTVRWYAAAVQ